MVFETTMILPISVCCDSELHNAISVYWECNIVPSNVICVL